MSIKESLVRWLSNESPEKPLDEIKKESSAILSEVQDASRKPTMVGKEVIVPLRFDELGEPLTKETFNMRKHKLRVNFRDMRFMHEWRKADWNADLACKALNIDRARGARIIKKIKALRREELIIEAKSKIPTPAWITAKHVDNVQINNLEDGQRDSLKELAKIVGAYKPTTNINLNADISMPVMAPEEEKRVREFFDTVAVSTTEQQNVA